MLLKSSRRLALRSATVLKATVQSSARRTWAALRIAGFTSSSQPSAGRLGRLRIAERLAGSQRTLSGWSTRLLLLPEAMKL